MFEVHLLERRMHAWNESPSGSPTPTLVGAGVGLPSVALSGSGLEHHDSRLGRGWRKISAAVGDLCGLVFVLSEDMATRSTQPELPSWQVVPTSSGSEEWEVARRWLDDYVSAWRSYDEDAIRALWSEDAIWYRPFGVRARGRDSITAEWMAEEHLFQKGGYDALYRPIAMDRGYVVTHGRTHFYDPTSGQTRRVYDNIWLLRLDSGGRCSEFHEWYSPLPEETD